MRINSLRWSKKFVATLVALIFLLTQVFPSIAENLGILESNSDTETVLQAPEFETNTIDSETVLTDLNFTDTETVFGEEEASSDAAEPQGAPPPPLPPPPYATTSQSMSIRIPNSIRVDPRATSFFMPKVSFRNSNTLLVCGYAAGARFDLSWMGSTESFDGADLKLAGDRTSQFRVTGSAAGVAELINNEKGLKVFTGGARITGQTITFRIVDISEPALDSNLCDEAIPENTITLRVLPLGIIQVITKNQVPLEKGPRS